MSSPRQSPVAKPVMWDEISEERQADLGSIGWDQKTWDHDQVRRAERKAVPSADVPKDKVSNIGIIAALMFVTVLSGSGLSVSGKQLGNSVPEHMFCILLVAVFMISGGFFASAYALAGHSGIDKETANFPKKKYAYMAVFDTLQMFLTMLAQPHVPGQVQGLVGKTNIPLSMVLRLFQGTTPSIIQVIGASCIVAGAIVGMLSKFSGGEGGEMDHFTIFWCAVFWASTVPAVIGVMYKESVLTESTVDENFMNGWVALFQAGFSILLLPLQLLLEDIPARDLAPKMHSGMACIAGFNTTKLEAGTAEETDNCPMAWRYVLAWLCALFLFNAALTSLLKHGGATMMFASQLLITPVTSMAYSLPVLMGAHAEVMSTDNLIGLALTVLGILIYRLPASLFATSAGDPVSKKED